jgi:hypothetical protein
VECKLLGYFGDGVKHWHDPIVEDVKVSCAQPEALQSETRAEIDERPFHWQRFEQRILVSVESQSGICSRLLASRKHSNGENIYTS